MIFVIVALLVIAALARYSAYKPFRYFKKKGIKYVQVVNPYLESVQMFVGLQDFTEDFLKVYRARPNERCYGASIFKIPTIILRDPELIQQVAIKDFDHYTDHQDTFFKEEIDPFFGKSLFALKGKRWHAMRTTLSPAFTGSKMRGMFQLMDVCGEQLVEHFNKQCNGNKPLEVEFKETTTRFTNDMIATTAFGIKVNSFENRDNEFYTIGRGLSKFSKWRFLVIQMMPKLGQLLGVRLMPTRIYDFFHNLIKDTIEVRTREKIIRPDMVHLLLEARKELEKKKQLNGTTELSAEDKSSQIQLTDMDISAQSFLFFFAGFETVSIAMCFSIYELCINNEIQKKLQKEIDEAVADGNGKFTYDAILKMKYLDMVLSETLRKWPPVAGIDRVCTKEHVLDVGDGTTINVEPGMSMQFPIMGLHRDSKYFENPEKFDPERFSDENKELIKPGMYIPFGFGPRICIASRFALLETKVLLCHLLKNFDFEVIEKTPIPMVLRKGATNLDAANGFWVGLKPRKAVH